MFILYRASGPYLPLFINKGLLEHSYACWFICCPQLFSKDRAEKNKNKKAGLSSSNTDAIGQEVRY